MGGGRTGLLYVVSAPSGTGKSTLVGRVLAQVPGVEFSVSYTTRPARAAEVDGKHYHFVDRACFQEMAAGNQFVEWAEVFGQFYGTGLAATRKVLDGGRDVLLDIDVEGARQVRESPLPSVSVMVLPPDYATLEGRLLDRGSESEEKRNLRLARARQEAEGFRMFDYVIVNDDLETSVVDLASIVRAERNKTSHCTERTEKIIATFPS